MFPFKFHLKYLLVLNYWFIGEFLLKICLEMKDVKENSVQWTDWDSNRECLKFDKVGKHSNSTKIISLLLNNYINESYHEGALPAIHITIHHTSVQYPLGQGFATFFRSRTTWAPRIVNTYYFFQNN